MSFKGDLVVHLLTLLDMCPHTFSLGNCVVYLSRLLYFLTKYVVLSFHYLFID